jgi:hypothetical protein
MRPLAMLTCLVLAACSSYELPAASPPEPAKAIAAAKQAAAEEKLVGAVEISAVREANLIAPGRYMLCLRGAISDTAQRRTYAVFFKGDAYLAVRMSVMIDSCETQVFTPFT